MPWWKPSFTANAQPFCFWFPRVNKCHVTLTSQTEKIPYETIVLWTMMKLKLSLPQQCVGRIAGVNSVSVSSYKHNLRNKKKHINISIPQRFSIKLNLDFLFAVWGVSRKYVNVTIFCSHALKRKSSILSVKKMKEKETQFSKQSFNTHIWLVKK